MSKCVCMLTSVHPAVDARIFFREARSLVRKGFDVTVIGVHDKDEVCQDVRIVSHRKFESRLLRILGSWKIFFWALRQRCDLFHFHDPELMPVGLLLKLLRKGYVVYDMHEDSNAILYKSYLPRKLRPVFSGAIRFFEIISARYLDGVITPTRLLTEKFMPYARRIVTLYNFPPNDFYKSVLKAGNRRKFRRESIIHLGVLRPSRLEFLLRVAKKIEDQIGPQPWNFVGLDKEMMELARRLIEGLGLNSIQINGKVPHQEVPGLLGRGRIGVNYHKLGEKHTNVAVPVKIFEYLACGLRVVSTPLPLVKELFQDIKFVSLAQDNVDDFSAKLLELLKENGEEEDRERIQKVAAERFCWAVEEKKLYRLYMEVLGEPA